MNGNLPDTFWTTQEELFLFLGSCLMGLPAGFLFDFWRILRRLRPHHAVLVALEDIVWLISSAALLLCYATACAKGVFRGYFAIGCVIGFVLYECTIGRAVTAFVVSLCRLLWTPVEKLGAGFALICKKVKCRFVKSSEKKKTCTENKKNRLHKPIGLVYNKLREPTKKGKKNGNKNKKND